MKENISSAKKQYISIFNSKGYKIEKNTLGILLSDKTSKKNIIWATDNYSNYGIGYQYKSQIMIPLITGDFKNIIRPRVKKTEKEKQSRIKEKGEVFTPTWVCNHQNNLVDNIWFGRENNFNFEKNERWTLNKNKIIFPKEKSWQNYVLDKRIEITCGEAPYLVSRYDTSSGEEISIENRVGIIDRKIRIINENILDENDWYLWVKKAYQSSYGYEWQGDSLLIARLNLLFTFIDYYIQKFKLEPNDYFINEIAEIISWNIWQMDGLKGVIPMSCKDDEFVSRDLFGNVKTQKCVGCLTQKIKKHNGVYCKIIDWEKNCEIKFIDVLKNKEGKK